MPLAVIGATAPGHPRAWRLRPILWIGAIAGTLDISEDLIFVAFRHITPPMVFRYIAAGLIGPGAAAAGLGPVALGVVLHYTIATAWTAAFYLAGQRWRILLRRPLLTGAIYGGLVYLIMTRVVVPWSRVPRGVASTSLAARVNGVLAVVVCIGLPIALLTRASLSPRAKGAPPPETGGVDRLARATASRG